MDWIPPQPLELTKSFLCHIPVTKLDGSRNKFQEIRSFASNLWAGQGPEAPKKASGNYRSQTHWLKVMIVKRWGSY